MYQYYIYIMTNQNNNVLYIGVTNNLIRRVYEHKQNIFGGFTNKYKLHKLVYYSDTNDINDAIAHEKRMMLFLE